jgi:hypothetical protein
MRFNRDAKEARTRLIHMAWAAVEGLGMVRAFQDMSFSTFLTSSSTVKISSRQIHLHFCARTPHMYLLTHVLDIPNAEANISDRAIS